MVIHKDSMEREDNNLCFQFVFSNLSNFSLLYHSRNSRFSQWKSRWLNRHVRILLLPRLVDKNLVERERERLLAARLEARSKSRKFLRVGGGGDLSSPSKEEETRGFFAKGGGVGERRWSVAARQLVFPQFSLAGPPRRRLPRQPPTITYSLCCTS